MQRVFVGVFAGLASVAAGAQTWTAEYDADAPPGVSTPAWHVHADEGASVAAAGGLLRMTSAQKGGGGQFLCIGRNTPDAYLKETEWGDASAWDGSKPSTLEFRMRVVETYAGCALAGQVQVSNGSDYFYLHLGPAGLCDARGVPRRAFDATQFHTYRVTLKEGVPNLYVDGEAFPAACFSPGRHGRNALIFGDVSSATAGVTEWAFIRWTNGEATPWERPEDRNVIDDKGSVWIDPRFTAIIPGIEHPCWGGHNPVRLADGGLLLVYWGPVGINHPPGSTRVFCRRTDDGGRTWGPEREVAHHAECLAVGSSAVAASDGAVHVFYMGFYRSVWTDGEPDMAQTRSDLWHTVSRDHGETWQKPQMAYRGYTGATNGAVQMGSGHLVVPFSYLVPSPGRLVSACVVSDDNGATWALGEAVDLGGHGDHAGAMEPTVVELSDERLWMLIRTTQGRFWEAFSKDHGLTWTDVAATEIASPSAPSHLTRLASSRLALVWNNTMATTQGRDALSLAFSEDDGATWTTPIVCARAGQVSYPHVFEAEPGLIWVCVHNVNAGFHRLAYVMCQAREADLLGGPQ